MTFASRFTDADDLVIEIAYLTDRSLALDGDVSHLAAGHSEDSVLAFLRHKLSRIACRSRDLAALAEKWMLNGCSEICFLIGGADGLLPVVRERADLVLAFGRLTLPHMLMRAVLAEQIYRLQTIIAHHPYHRE